MSSMREITRSGGAPARDLPTLLYRRPDLWSERPRRTIGYPLETTLSAPVKTFLETLGFTVKGEVGGCDLMGLSADAPPLVVVCELKMSFNMELVLQGVERAAVADEVWLAAKLSKKGKGREADARFRNLVRRLGFGLLGVTDSGTVEVLLSPDAVAAKRNPRKRSKLIAEHQRRRGDPVLGGGSRAPIMTAYRQSALACAAMLEAGPLRPRDITPAVPKAPTILRRNVYGWFANPERGLYAITEAGRAALARWPQTPEDAPVEKPAT